LIAIQASFIGDSDVPTTYDRYGKVVPEDLAPAAAQLEEHFNRSARGRPSASGRLTRTSKGATMQDDTAVRAGVRRARAV
jgi:hypothetical protein